MPTGRQYPPDGFRKNRRDMSFFFLQNKRLKTVSAYGPLKQREEMPVKAASKCTSSKKPALKKKLEMPFYEQNPLWTAPPGANPHAQVQRIGYVRVSTARQNPARQLCDVQLNRIYIDKCSGITVDRPAFNDLLFYVRPCDTVFVHSVDRLARDLNVLKELMQKLHAKGATVVFHTEGLSFVPGNPNPMNDFKLHMLGSFAEFERTVNRKRQAEGIALAMKEGRYKTSAKVAEGLQADLQEGIRRLHASGMGVMEIARRLGIGRTPVLGALEAGRNAAVE